MFLLFSLISHEGKWYKEDSKWHKIIKKATEDQVKGNALAAQILLEEFNNIKYNFLKPYKIPRIHQQNDL